MNLNRRQVIRGIWGCAFGALLFPFWNYRGKFLTDNHQVVVSNKVFFKPNSGYKTFLSDLSHWLDVDAYERLTKQHLESGQAFSVKVSDNFVETRFVFKNKESCLNFFDRFYQIGDISRRAELGYRYERNIHQSWA